MGISVLGIAGGTRRGGNSEYLLDRALDGAIAAGARVEKQVLLDLALSPCICPQSEDCLPTGVCTVVDEMQRLYATMRTVDMVFLSFPVTFRGVPAQTKTLFDRTQALWVMKYKLGRTVRAKPGKGHGLVIATADRDDPSEFDGAVQATRSWFVSFDFLEERRLLYHGLVRSQDVLAHPEYAAEAYEAGRELAERLGRASP
ncbi:MAG: flavodoxin family protein [Chloroflexi bacterium]|nr:flavodoxin family protein [Chloroflexota bacterium]